MGIKSKATNIHTKKLNKTKVVSQNSLLHTQAILSSLNSAILIVNNDNVVDFVSEAFCQLYGLSESSAQLQGLSGAEIIKKISKTRINISEHNARIKEIMAKGKLVKDEIITIKGGRTYMRDFIPLMVDGKSYGWIWYHHDVTERKHAEAAQKESEERFRKLFENHAAIMLVIDLAKGDIIDANKAAVSYYGWPIEKLRQMHIGQINTLSPELLKREMEKVKSSFNTAFEFRHRKADGSIWDVEVFSNKIEIGGKELLYSIIHDITNRKRAEAERGRLEMQNRQLQKSESLTRMAGAIAHHFNNQLQAIMMNMEMAKSYLPHGTGSTEFLSDVMKSARKAAEVSNLMLTYLGKTVAKREPLDLGDICKQHLPVLRAAITKDLVIEADVRMPGPIINGNANQIQQILTNLVTNAMEAMNGSPGAIGLSVKVVSSANIPKVNRFPVNYELQDKAYACFEVSDTGCGIADKDIENLFDPFFSSKFIGRGMGLAVVLGILRAHGGSIVVESNLSCGSTFRVFLPMLAKAAPSKPIPTPPIQRSGLILVVEDESAVRNAFEVVIRLFGYTVLTAKDGVEAIEIFRKHQNKIDCVLCDLCMPRLNGWDTLAALRKLSPKIPVIMTSGYSESDVMAGCDHSELPEAFLSKPFDLQKLAETITRVLEKASRAKL